MKTLPKYAVVLIAIAAGVVTLLLFGSILFALAVGLVVPVPLSRPVSWAKLALALVIAIVLGYLVGWGLGAIDPDRAGTVHFAGSFATMALFASFYVLALRKQATADAGTRSAVLSLQPPPGQALVIVRRKGFVGYASAVEVIMDSSPLAQLSMGRFTALHVAPGRHALAAAMATVSGPGKQTVVEFELAAGQTAAFHASFVTARLLQGHVELTRDADPQAVARTLAGRAMVIPAPVPALAQEA